MKLDQLIILMKENNPYHAAIYLENEDLTPGYYSFIWQGNSHSSGVYFVTLQAILEPYEPVVMSRKMIYLK